MKNPTYYTGYASGVDKNGHIHQITAVGVREEIKDTCIENMQVSLDSKYHGKFYCELAPNKVYRFNVSFAISNPNDTIDMKLGERVAKRRLDRNDFLTIELESDKIIPAPICQAIVDAEAIRIAAKVDSYIKKLLRV